MRLLLDTHTAFWAVSKRSKLPSEILDLIKDPINLVWVSVVSIWEISIKHALAREGAGRMPISGRQAAEYFTEAMFSLLPMTLEHSLRVDQLPKLHGDPFDRLLAAQALSEPLRLVTHDASLAAYSDLTILF